MNFELAQSLTQAIRKFKMEEQNDGHHHSMSPEYITRKIQHKSAKNKQYK